MARVARLSNTGYKANADRSLQNIFQTLKNVDACLYFILINSAAKIISTINEYILANVNLCNYHAVIVDII